MFKKNQLSIFGWFILILILSVPILNLIFIIWGFITNRFSQNIKNFIVAYLVIYYIFGLGAFQSGLL